MRGTPITYYDFSGGINLEAAPYLLETNQARAALNVHTNRNGQLRKRNGVETAASLSALNGPALSLGVSNLASKHLLVAGPTASGVQIYSVTAGGTVTDRTATPFTNGLPWYFAQAPVTSGAKGPIFAMNGTDTPQHWTGAGDFANWTADVGAVPNGKYLTYHGNRLWCAVGSRLHYSGITGTSPDTGNWDANNYVDLEPEDGQEITAICPQGAYLLVFKPRKIFVIYDLVTGANRQISDSAGCAAHFSCVETPQGVFFLDEDQGVMVTDGNSATPVSDAIRPLLREAAEFPATFRQAAGVFNDNRYYLSISEHGSINDLTLEYDLDTQSWWMHDFGANGWALLDPVTAPQLYAANANDELLSRAFVPDLFTDNDANYTGGAYWIGSQQMWGEPHIQKRVTQVRVDGLGEWTLGYAQDHSEDFTSDAGEVWSTTEPEEGTFAPPTIDGEVFAPSAPTGDTFAPISTAVTERRYYTLGVARAWSFSFNNDDEGDFQIYSITIATRRRED